MFSGSIRQKFPCTTNFLSLVSPLWRVVQSIENFRVSKTFPRWLGAPSGTIVTTRDSWPRSWSAPPMIANIQNSFLPAAALTMRTGTPISLLFLFVCANHVCCISSLGIKISDVHVNRIYLRQNEPNSPYCFVASSASEVANKKDKSSSINFLATQVWPSARVAATFVEQHMDPSWTVCEFGCGPALPSLTAAKQKAKKIFATDLDTFALELVQRAGKEQGFDTVLETRKVDLTDDSSIGTVIPKSDLFLFSDVFESSAVALGAARVTENALNEGARVWVFAQSDRVQREVYLREMKTRLKDPSLCWAEINSYDPDEHKLFLCDIDETTVCYG